MRHLDFQKWMNLAQLRAGILTSQLLDRSRPFDTSQHDEPQAPQGQFRVSFTEIPQVRRALVELK